MTTGLKAGQLEMKLLTMPYERMIAALEAIDELDTLVLDMLQRESNPKAVEWQRKIEVRRTERARFVALRRNLSMGGTDNGSN